MRNLSIEYVNQIAEQFCFEGELLETKPYGNGHINDTFLLTYEVEEMGTINVILQRMNKSIFPDPVGLMENVQGVTEFLKKKVEEYGGDPYRETLTVIPSVDGKAFYQDEQGEFWRAYVYIFDTVCYDLPENKEMFYASAYTFGRFQKMLADYPADTLHETIANFHNTKVRFATFKKAVAEDVMGRAKDVQEEIKFVLDREDVANCFTDMLEHGELPLRVTHNDTKLNNILMDAKTGQGLCVIDLDTVMPGLAMNDFGDAIRFGASTAAEDEQDLSKVSCDMELFETYVKGFLEGCDGGLTAQELNFFLWGQR